MAYKSINFNDKFNQFNELWSPKVVSEMNDYQFKLVKIKEIFNGIVINTLMNLLLFWTVN